MCMVMSYSGTFVTNTYIKTNYCSCIPALITERVLYFLFLSFSIFHLIDF